MSDTTGERIGEVLARVMSALSSHRVADCAFTGGVAVGVWARPRQTRDIDVCGGLPPEEVDRLLALRDGLRSGAEALPDLVRFRVGDWDVDLFVCKDAYDRACLDRAIATQIDDVDVRVVTAQSTALDWSHVRAWLPKDEADLLQSVATADDETLARAFLPR